MVRATSRSRLHGSSGARRRCCRFRAPCRSFTSKRTSLRYRSSSPTPSSRRSASDMTFSELATYLDQLEATSSRNELVRILAEAYKACSVEEIEPITYLIQGRLAPFFEPVEMGLGERLLMSAVAAAYKMEKDEVVKLNRKVGD